MREIKRIYIYKENYEEIACWGLKNNIDTPNNRPNFPTYLEKKIQSLNNEIEKLKEELYKHKVSLWVSGESYSIF